VSFGLPSGTEPPPDPQPKAGGDWWPHVISQVRQDDGTMLVTFAMPSLTRFTVRVPLTSWLNGEHMVFVGLPVPLLSVLAIEPGDSESEDDGGSGHDPPEYD
jgi:hypothetical protein